MKNYICENNKIGDILEALECKFIKYHPHGNPDPYWTAGNYDGDNPQAILVYRKPSLLCFNYTRDISQNNDYSDLIALVCFVKDISFPQAKKYICDLLGIDYYKDPDEDLPDSLQITKLIYEMQSNNNEESEEKPLKPISEKILTYYEPFVNDLFYNDGIDYETQREFEIGYDPVTNRITIPIRDEIGTLIGCKGRLFKTEIKENESKYLYLESCAKSKILYGLYKTYPFIKNEGRCFIGESEKFVLQLWSMGYYNCVGLGGKKITSHQIEKLSRLCVDLVFCLDKDVSKKEIENMANKFIDGIGIYYLYDEENILSEKESPSDNKKKFKYLLKNHLYKIK